MPYSKINDAVANVLKKEGYLSEVKTADVDGWKTLQVTLRYENRRPVLRDVEVISKPSLRVYAGHKHVEESRKKGARLAVVSTSQGVMSGRDAQKKGIGGEVLFTIL